MVEAVAFTIGAGDATLIIATSDHREALAAHLDAGRRAFPRGIPERAA